ncbi:MAG TPA: hypothetical protein VJ783_28085 [Pirellulales bacterium]|nr:hypothetical protein [Pirellulales bacterium]
MGTGRRDYFGAADCVGETQARAAVPSVLIAMYRNIVLPRLGG